MIKAEMFKIVKELPFDKKVSVFKKGNTEVQIYRPSVLSARFKTYDKNKNFQIWLKEGTREFRPNHLRIMIDLNLRVRSRANKNKWDSINKQRAEANKPREEKQEESVSPEEHKKRLEMLKSLGIIKE